MKFILYEKLNIFDTHGLDYTYELAEHPHDKDTIVVFCGNDGHWLTFNYSKDEVKFNFDHGHWIEI